MLRKKIPQSGLLMLPRRLWMQTVPTQDCEVVVMLSPSCGEETVNWLANSLRTRIPELIINVKSHMAVSSYALYVTATMDGLVKGGEELRLPKKTKPEYGSGLRELSQAELGIFQGVEEPATFFTSQERQSIVLYLLHSLRGVDGDHIAAITFMPGQAIISKFENVGIIQKVVPLHDQQLLLQLRATWVQSFFRYQPLDLIHEYFGAKIGIYFSWLGFYTASLTVPAIIGFVFWIHFWGRDQAKEDKAFVVLAFLNVVWGSTWLEAWKRRSADLTHRWGIQDPQHELLQDPRAHFTGEIKSSAITGRMEPVYPLWKRNLFRYMLTIPVVFVCLCLVFIVMFIILQFQDWVDGVIEYRGLPSLISYGPRFIMAVMISVFDEIYNRVAVWLNDMENYRSEENYQNHLIIKLAVFRLVNSFLVFFYIAFYLQDMEVLKAQLAVLFVTRQIVGNIKESCIPYIWEQLKMAKLSFDLFGALSPTTEKARKEELASQVAAADKDGTLGTKEEGGEEEKLDKEKNEKVDDLSSERILPRLASKSRLVSQAEVECNMAKYNDTFEDYLEMFIQFGYVMLFSSAFPLAGLCAFVNNLIEIRSDAFKLCFAFQRPFGQRVRSIGVWQDAMELMCLLGIIVNCMLIGLSGQVHRMFPEMSTTQTILLIVVLEHAMIALKYGISYAIPDVPTSIAQEIAKAEFRRREALKKLSASNSPPTMEESGQSSPKSFPMSHLPSVEYIERSVQTDAHSSMSSRKSSLEIKPLKEFIRKDSAESKHEFEIKHVANHSHTHSTSVSDKAKHVTPKLNKRLNEIYMDTSHLSSTERISSVSTSSEALHILSAPAHFEGRKRSFNFVQESEKSSPVVEYIPSPEKGSELSSRSKSSESVAASTIREERLASENLTVTENLPEKRQINVMEERRLSSPLQSQVTRKRLFPSSEHIPVASPTEAPHEEGAEGAAAAAGKEETPKLLKKHPAKFLKRAQSFSQVFSFKKNHPTEKKKKHLDTLRDDYRLAMIREPLGELALVPLEKLVSIEDLRTKLSINEEQ